MTDPTTRGIAAVISAGFPMIDAWTAGEFPAVDETCANTAVISLMGGLCVSGADERLLAYWDPTRIPFRVTNTDSTNVYEARVDGVFRRPDGPPLIILEVKAALRQNNPYNQRRIEMQEAAELAAWIHAYPPLLPKNDTENPKF